MKTPSRILKLRRQIKQLHTRLTTPGGLRLSRLHDSGELAIIAIGFRCFTKSKIKERLGVELKKSYPFDNGFFPPISIARVLKTKRINLNFDQPRPNHTVCIKYENYNDPAFGYGIKFRSSTYEEINSAVASRDMDGINKYLDSSFGYYTLDMENQFVLAHYNWHSFANEKKPERIHDPIANINNINGMLNRRLDRMFEKCNAAKYVLLVFGETQGYRHMMIDDHHFDLNDLSPIEKVAKEIFVHSNVFVKKLDDVNTPQKVLSLLDITRI
jgi:hypothetical protein